MKIKNLAADSRFKKNAAWLITFILIFLCICYWFFNRNYISTDNAYVNANIIQISPQVTGKISKIYIKNNQLVQKGEPLFDIDDESFKVAVERNRARLELTRLEVGQETSAITAAEAELHMRNAELQHATLTANRIKQLFKKHFASQQDNDDAQLKQESAKAAVLLAQANLERAKKKLGTAGEDNEQIRQSQMELKTASLDLAYTHVTAPAQGYITNFKLHIGDVVQEDQPLFALINDKEFWVDANFKETDLEYIKPGQSAKIKVDMYPGFVFQGVVNSISKGSGAAFSLLPPENATGNWVKVTQRVPVKIMIINPDATHLLRVGTTASVAINIHKKV